MRNVLTDRKVFSRYLTAAEERKLFSHVKQYADVLARRDAAWMMLLRDTGIRVGTLAGLTVGDAKAALRTGVLALPDEICKGGHGYDVALVKRIEATLQQLLDLRAEQGHLPDPDAPLLMSKKRQGLSVRSLQARMQGWAKAAGIKRDVSPHWWRHTHAMALMANSETRDPRGLVQVRLGHVSASSTMLYTMPTHEDMERAVTASLYVEPRGPRRRITPPAAKRKKKPPVALRTAWHIPASLEKVGAPATTLHAHPRRDA